MSRNLIRLKLSVFATAGAALLCGFLGFVAGAAAQEVDIFYDEYGRRIILDAYTGEIVRIDPPRRSREAEPRVYMDEDGYYIEVYPPFEDDYVRSLPPPAEPPARVEPPIESEPPVIRFPDAPAAPEPQQERAEEPIERAPLEEPEQTASAPALARPEPGLNETTASQNELAALQVLLDRAGASPGVIDGRMGQNFANALDAYREITGQAIDPNDAAAVTAALEKSGGPAFTTYTITAADMDGQFIAAVPVDYGEKARLSHLSYTSPAEKLAERFHMDERYLKALNPEVDFARPGQVITVASTGPNVSTPVVRIVADKGKEQVRAYDEAGKLVAAYPATIGSTATPSPSGTHTVERIAFNPEYTYNPKINFKQGENDRILTIPPGPNGPVGTIWIALSKPTYGIHGTPEPSQIGKTNSNGCVRLTNWDAQELARLVKKGVTVEFVD